MKKAIPIITALLALASVPLHAQLPELERPDVIPPSPEASKLAAYISYPVNLSNGLVQTSIPLYEIVDGDIRIPITLSYHASGLKPNMRSSHWLGDGWSLTTGPTLSRTINGVADEINYNAQIALCDSPTYEQLNAIYTQAVDVALDEFHYSLPGGGGRMYLRRMTDGSITPVTIPRDNITVKPLGGKSMPVFRITDGDGMTYTFGGGENRYHDRVTHKFGISALEVPTSWKIREIRSATTGRSVTFDYTANIMEIFCGRYADALVMIDNFISASSDQAACTIPLVNVSTYQSFDNKIYQYDSDSGCLVEADMGVVKFPDGYTFPMPSKVEVTQYNSYVRRIDFSGGHVLFNLSPDINEGLRSMEVYDLSGNLVKRVMFNQTYTGTTFSLRLDSVSIESPDGEESETYSFAYNGVSPPRDTRSIDKWGYYNGRENSTLVPTVTTDVMVNNYPYTDQTVTLTIPGGDRSPDETAMQAGILTSVTYPTGGRTEFSYEAHRYIDDYGASHMAGGLRIRQIRDVESDGNVLYRNFRYSTYATHIDGGGVLSVIPASSSYPTDTNEIYYRETACAGYGGTLMSPVPTLMTTYKERVWTDNSMVGLVSSDGSSVSYPYVFESRSSDAAGTQTTGETLHAFDVSASHPIKRPGTSLIHDNRQEWTHGHKVSETAYGLDSDGSPREVKGTAYDHSTELDYGTNATLLRQRHVYKATRVYGEDELRVPEEHKEILCQTTTLTQGRKLLASVTEKATETNGTLTKTTLYAYDSYGNVVTKTEDVGLPGHDRRVTAYSYPQDMTGGGYTAMASAGMTGIPVETRVYKNSISGANLLTTLSTEYSSHPCASGTFIAPSSRSLTVRGDASTGRRILLNEYDRRGNLLEFEDNDGRRTVYLWGYNGRYPVSAISGSDWSSVKARIDTSVLNTGTTDVIRQSLDAFRDGWSQTPGVHVSTYTHNSLVGLSTATDPSGRTTGYGYDGLGRLSRTYLADGDAEETVSTHSYRYGAYAGGNRIQTREYLDASGASFRETNLYHDRLGRPVETVRTAASPDGRDIAELSEHDAFGRPCREYRPVPLTTSTGAYAPFSAVHPEILKFYNWEVYAFSKTLYEASPLDRVTEEYGPGSPWHTRGRSVRTSYLVNDGSGLLSCSGYLVESDTSVTCIGTLSSGNLNVVEVTDEDGNVSLTFTDKLGRKTLERTVDGERYQDTYYVYDDLGLLRYVLTPEASAVMSSTGTFGDSSSPLSMQAYVYKYDGKGRCVSERRPGCAHVLYRYDKGDVPVFTQDGEMRKKGEWRFSFRDVLGRGAVSGMWPSQNAPSSVNIPVVATYSGSSSLGGYSLNIPIPPNNRLLSVNYYDDYSFMDDLLISDTKRGLSCDTLSSYGIPVAGADKAKGFLTGTAVHSMIDPASKTVSAFYYDYQGRLIQSHRKEALGGYRHTHQSLTFTGKPSKTRESVTLPDGHIDSLVTLMSYDPQERLVSETSSLNGKTQTVSYAYDGIGRLTGRTHGLGDNPSGLTETLTYNIRDQLTGLNSNVFGMTLRYHDPVLGSSPRYNGSVSEWEWNRGSGTQAHAWSLSYDGVGRLTDARRFTGGVSTDAFGERSVTYDRNGNVLTLTRYGADTASPEEALAYSYNGDLLIGISNTGTSGGGGTYMHDTNGNMTRDGLSGLDIEYDEMNLTRRISSDGTTLAGYEHLADGTKFSAVDGSGDGYQYRGSMIYSQTATSSGAPTLALDCALTSAGRIARVTGDDGSASYRSLIHLRDHLGSVRAIVDGDTGSVIEENDYYPFGKRIQVAGPVASTRSATGGGTVPTVTSVISATSPNRWRFSGKEDQSCLSAAIPLLDFGARMYNPVTARWTAADPMAEKYYGTSPYAYCLDDPVCMADLYGLTSYNVNGTIHEIQDGYDDVINVTRREFRAVRRDWNRGYGGAYDDRRQDLMDKHGYIDASGNMVLAAATSISSQSGFRDQLYSTFALMVAIDLPALDPTDLFPHKWAGYAVGATALGTDYFIRKMNAEITGIGNRPDGPSGVQYALIATTSGDYPNTKGGNTALKAGEIWKYGETTQSPPENRYGGKRKLEERNLRMEINYSGSQKQIKIEEKRKLYSYYLKHGHLPPGNSIFR